MSRTSPDEATAAPHEPGIPGSALAGPFPVGEYAAALRGRLRSFTRVQLVGELVNLRPARARVYFELRDSSGAIPCAVWQKDWDQILTRLGGQAGGQAGSGAGGAPIEGMQVVVAGGCDFYPGSPTSSPGFSFSVADLRVAREGDLLARIDRLRKTLHAEGLLARQQLLHLPLLPRTIGVITGESGKARDDILAALARRGWAGRLIWGFAPVQDRHAAPAIVRALGDLAAVGEVEVAIVARGGGSLADLLCFCDETLCRTVALLGVPVIASVGHHTDRTLLDDVAAVSCSTPTHAAEAAIGIDCLRARSDTAAAAQRLQDHGRRALLPRASLPVAASRLGDHGRRAVLSRARLLASLSRAPAGHLARQRTRLHQQLREVRAGSRRRVEAERALSERRVLVLQRKNQSALLDARERHPRQLRRLALTLAAHDPQRTLERGYALVESPSGEPLPTAATAREARDVRLRFADASVPAKILP
jgi:exodeoxyribonuclease VII large subunit